MKKQPKKFKRNVLIATMLSLVFISASWMYFSSSKEDIPAQPLFSLSDLSSNNPFDLKIKTDLKFLFDKNKSDNYQKAKCTFKYGETIIHEGKMSIKKRGVTRKKICSIPPIMLKFGKGKKKVKLKMVVPCKDGDEYQQLVYKEYLTYQMYNQLTPYSFKAQLVKILLEDTEGNNEPIEVDGFVIEDDKCIASRTETDVMSDHEKLKFIDQDKYRLFTMFQYCIGNTDWNLNHRHNIKMVCKKDSKTPIPIPYDFDYSGLVNAPYAVPHHNMPIDNVKERYFMWRGKTKEGFEKVIELFHQKKESLVTEISNFPYLKEKEKEEFLTYLEEFYLQLKNESMLAAN